MWIQRTAVAALILASSGAATAQPANLNCKIGPIEKTYGGTKWNVYGCDDKKSVVIVTSPGNPAMPFYFFFLPKSGGYELHGEGTGDKKITDAAYKDLAALTDADVAALAAEASRR
ncbi:MAG TPA: hypothetical protein VLV55_00425 [Rhizomicrobium sp.]|nr:hypothetical protein [Rhizomicrobium sp.]